MGSVTVEVGEGTHAKPWAIPTGMLACLGNEYCLSYILNPWLLAYILRSLPIMAWLVFKLRLAPRLSFCRGH